MLCTVSRLSQRAGDFGICLILGMLPIRGAEGVIMKKIFVASLALLAIGATSQAQAADLVLKAPPAAVWSWTGFYVGGNAGYSWGRSNTDFTFRDSVTGTALATLNQSIGLNGGIAGVQAGYNWQNGRIV